MKKLVAAFMSPGVVLLATLIFAALAAAEPRMRAGWQVVFLPWYLLDAGWMLAIISYVLMQKIRSAGASIWMGVALFIAVLAKLLFDILLPRRLDGLSSMSYVACVAPLLLSLAIVTAILLRATRASVMGLRH